MNERGSLFVITGPSGVGKGTVLRIVRQKMPELYYSISMTTRAPREEDKEGVTYFFTDKEDFLRKVKKGEMLEYASYAGNYYGTPAGPVDSFLAAGRDVILEIEVQGALQVKSRRPDAVLIFLVCPSKEEHERRLRGRGTETEEQIRLRLEAAAKEYAQADEFDFVVINDTPENGADEILSVITAERCRYGRRKNLPVFSSEE